MKKILFSASIIFIMIACIFSAGCILEDNTSKPDTLDGWMKFIEQPPSDYTVDVKKMLVFYDQHSQTKSFTITYMNSGDFYSFDIELLSPTLHPEIDGFSKFDNALDNYVYVVIDDSLINPKVTNVIEKETGKSVCSIMYLTTERYNWMIEIMERWFKETNTK